MRLILFYVSLTLLSFNLYSKSFKGRVIEKGTRTPLEGISIYLLPSEKKIVSLEDGLFELTEEDLKNNQIIINKSGYLKLDSKIKNLTNDFTLYLEREFYDVFETTVTALAEKDDIAKKTLLQDEFMKAPGAQEDPVKAVQNLPGIASQSFSSQVVIQGSEPDGTLYTFNGHEIPLVFHFGGLTSIVTPQSIESVDFLASGYGPEYGRALGGIINLSTRTPKKDRWHGEFFLDITKMGALVEGKTSENGSLFLSSRVSYFGKALDAAMDEESDLSFTAAPEFQDTYLQYNYKLNDTDIFSIEYLRSKDSLGVDIAESNNPAFEGRIDQQTNFYRILPRYVSKLSDKTTLDISVAYGEDDILADLPDDYFFLNTSTFSQRLALEHQFNSQFTSTFGIDSQRREFDVKIKFPEFTNQGGVNSTTSGDSIVGDIDGEFWESSFYFLNKWNINSRSTLYPSVRETYFSETEKLYLEPRLAYTYQFNDVYQLQASSGIYYQAPKNGEASEDFGNPDLLVEKSYHYYLGLVSDFRAGSNQGLLLDGGVFYKTLDDLIISTDAQRSDGSSVRFSNRGEGKVIGAQLQGSYKYNQWTGLISYTYLNSTRSQPAQGEFPSEFDQTHNLNLIGIYEEARWTFSTRLRYVTGNPYTPIIGGVYDSDNDVYIPSRGEFFSQRYDEFFQLDFRVDRKWIYNNWILSAYLDIQNITNSKNPQSITYNYDYSDEKTVDGLPIIPILGIRGEF